jgi:hypothetical protein
MEMGRPIVRMLADDAGRIGLYYLVVRKGEVA